MSGVLAGIPDRVDDLGAKSVGFRIAAVWSHRQRSRRKRQKGNERGNRRGKKGEALHPVSFPQA